MIPRLDRLEDRCRVHGKMIVGFNDDPSIPSERVEEFHLIQNNLVRIISADSVEVEKWLHPQHFFVNSITFHMNHAAFFCNIEKVCQYLMISAA